MLLALTSKASGRACLGWLKKTISWSWGAWRAATTFPTEYSSTETARSQLHPSCQLWILMATLKTITPAWSHDNSVYIITVKTHNINSLNVSRIREDYLQRELSLWPCHVSQYTFCHLIWGQVDRQKGWSYFLEGNKYHIDQMKKERNILWKLLLT